MSIPNCASARWGCDLVDLRWLSVVPTTEKPNYMPTIA